MAKSPASILYNSDGSAVGVVLDGAVYRLQTADKIESWFGSTAPTVGPKQIAQSIPVALPTDQVVNVLITHGSRSYYHSYLVAANVPAIITAGVAQPYAVGGTTLTINVNGSGNQTCPFPTRVAQPGIHYSAPYPATSNPTTEKLKVSVNGGALVEVKIGKGLTSGAAIAASLQTQIRALVPNGGAGTGVTVQYDTTEYPFRYIFKSGTTGSSSRIHVEQGGDALATFLLVGASSGTERIGLDADNYWAFEVDLEISERITDVIPSLDTTGTKVLIQTVLGGSSATLQVTAGGANTYLQFPTTLVSGVTGSGSMQMNVNGSVTTVRYAITPPADAAFVVEKLLFLIRSDNCALKTWGSIAAGLTNGVKIELKPENSELISTFTVKTHGDLFAQAGDGEILADSFAAGGKDMVHATFDFGAGFRVVPGSNSNIYVTIQDNLTTLPSMLVLAKGLIET